MCRLTEKRNYEVPLGLSGSQQLHKQQLIGAVSNEEVEKNTNDDPFDKMVTFLTGRTKRERLSKERSIIFPVKLMYVLECGKYNHIVGWKLDAESNEQYFIVYDLDIFAETILPTFFKVAKYDSFQRKLYRWGFIKTRRTKADKLQLPKSACYVHPFFRPGDYDGASQMTCSGVDVEFCKTEQKKRKRQQREKGFKVSKKTAASNSNVKKTTEQKSISSIQLIARDPFRGMEAIPSLLPSTIRMNGRERIDDSTVSVLSRDSSTLNSQHKTRVLPSYSRNSSSDDDISKLLARVKDQRQLQRIQQNNLMREKLLQEMQDSASFFDEIGMHLSSRTPNHDFSSSSALAKVAGGNTESYATGSLSSDSCSNQFGVMTNNSTLNNSGFVGDYSGNHYIVPFNNALHQSQQQRKQAHSLFQYQDDTLMMTTRSDSNGVDYRQKRREGQQRIINNALDVLKLS